MARRSPSTYAHGLALLAMLLLAMLPTAKAATDEPALRIPLQRNLRFVVRPTLLGLLPPPDSQNFGEAFIRVSAVSPEHVWLRYDLKEQLQRDPGSGELYLLESAPPERRVERVTRIRRGLISTTRQALPGLQPPMLWPDGSWPSSSPLLWLDSAGFAMLRSGQDAPLTLTLPQYGLPQLDELSGLAELRRQAAGLAPDEPLSLQLLQAGASYRCLVNGRAVDLPALRAVDSMLLAEYWFLDDADNPLLLKLSYLPLQSQNEGLTGWAAMVNAGGGCAITRIDF